MSSDKDFHDKTAKINLEQLADLDKELEYCGQRTKICTKRKIELREAHRRIWGHPLKEGCGSEVESK